MFKVDKRCMQRIFRFIYHIFKSSVLNYPKTCVSKKKYIFLNSSDLIYPKTYVSKK